MERFLLPLFVVFSSFVLGQSMTLDWALGTNTSNSSYPIKTVTDAFGNVYTSGFTYATSDLDPSAGFDFHAAGAFVQKIDANGNFQWAISWDGSSVEIRSLAIDQNNNLVISGKIANPNTDMDPGSGTAIPDVFAQGKGYVMKFDPNGNFLWVKNFGDSNTANAWDIAITSTDDIVLTGYFNNTGDFDPGSGTANLTAVSPNDAFLLKLNSTGDFIWAKSFGGVGFAWPWGIALDWADNIYTCGMFDAAIDLNPAGGTMVVSNGSYDAYVSKFNPSGNFLWGGSFGSAAIDYAYDIEVNSASQVYLTGLFENTIDIDLSGPGTQNLTSNGNEDVYLVKYSSAGNLLSGYNFGSSTGRDEGYSIEIDNSNNLYMTGRGGTFDMDPGPGTFQPQGSGHDNYLIKLDQNDNFIYGYGWDGSNASNRYTDAALDGEDVIIGGVFGSTMDFDPTNDTFELSSGSNENMYVLKMSTCLGASAPTLSAPSNYCNGGSIDLSVSSGNLNQSDNWSWYEGTTLLGTGNTITHSPSSGGVTYAVVGEGSCASMDTTYVFVEGLQHSENWITVNACDSYTVPSGDETYVSSGSIMDTISNAAGCDSVLHISLNVYNTTYSTINPSQCVSYTVPSGDETYTVSGTYYDTIPNGNGCNEIITINLTILNPTTSTINPIACDSYLAPDGSVYSSTGVYTAVIPNSQGCDSTITIDLTVNNSTSSSITPIACNSYIAPDGASYTSSGIYSATIANSAGCDSIITIDLFVQPELTQDLCVVTTDEETSSYNIVVWEKPNNIDDIDSFYVYREITLGNYQKIGAVHRDSLSEFKDLSANPNITSYKYKISVLDSCGNEGIMSLYHNSIHLQYFGSGNFQWSQYEIESTSNQVASYNFYRDDNSTGNYQLLQVVPGGNTSFTDINYNSFPNASYVVDVNWLSGEVCTASKANDYNSSRSNRSTPSAIGSVNEFESNFNVYPNPASDVLHVKSNYGQSFQVQLLGVEGNILQQFEENESQVIDVSKLPNGVYHLLISSANSLLNKKLVVSH